MPRPVVHQIAGFATTPADCAARYAAGHGSHARPPDDPSSCAAAHAGTHVLRATLALATGPTGANEGDVGEVDCAIGAGSGGGRSVPGEAGRGGGDRAGPRRRQPEPLVGAALRRVAALDRAAAPGRAALLAPAFRQNRHRLGAAVPCPSPQFMGSGWRWARSCTRRPSNTCRSSSCCSRCSSSRAASASAATWSVHRRINTGLLAFGTGLASLTGTTGAAMLLVRPLDPGQPEAPPQRARAGVLHLPGRQHRRLADPTG